MKQLLAILCGELNCASYYIENGFTKKCPEIIFANIHCVIIQTQYFLYWLYVAWLLLITGLNSWNIKNDPTGWQNKWLLTEKKSSPKPLTSLKEAFLLILKLLNTPVWFILPSAASLEPNAFLTQKGNFSREKPSNTMMEHWRHNLRAALKTVLWNFLEVFQKEINYIFILLLQQNCTTYPQKFQLHKYSLES